MQAIPSAILKRLSQRGAIALDYPCSIIGRVALVADRTLNFITFRACNKLLDTTFFGSILQS